MGWVRMGGMLTLSLKDTKRAYRLWGRSKFHVSYVWDAKPCKLTAFSCEPFLTTRVGSLWVANEGRIPYYPCFLFVPWKCAKMIIWGFIWTPVPIWPSQDNLLNLSQLFDIVGRDVKCLVVFMSEGLFQSPWCTGEICSAFSAKVHMVNIACDGYTPPDYDEVNMILSSWTEDRKNALLTHGFDMDAVRTLDRPPWVSFWLSYQIWINSGIVTLIKAIRTFSSLAIFTSNQTWKDTRSGCTKHVYCLPKDFWKLFLRFASGYLSHWFPPQKRGARMETHNLECWLGTSNSFLRTACAFLHRVETFELSRIDSLDRQEAVARQACESCFLELGESPQKRGIYNSRSPISHRSRDVAQTC